MDSRFTADMKRRFAALLTEQDWLEGRARLIEASIRELEGIRLKLETIPEIRSHYAALIQHDQPSWTPDSVEWKRMRPHGSEFGRGIIGNAVFELLRDSDEPLTQLEITDEIRRRLTPRYSHTLTLYTLAQMVTQLLSHYRHSGLIDSDGGRPKRWAFVPLEEDQPTPSPIVKPREATKIRRRRAC